jgi:hypothetical protein
VYCLYYLYELLQALRDGVSEMRGIAIAIAQAVSRWLPTATALVRTLVRSCGICVDKVALVQVFYSCSTLIIIYHPEPGLTYQVDSVSPHSKDLN